MRYTPPKSLRPGRSFQQFHHEVRLPEHPRVRVVGYASFDAIRRSRASSSTRPQHLNRFFRAPARGALRQRVRRASVADPVVRGEVAEHGAETSSRSSASRRIARILLVQLGRRAARRARVASTWRMFSRRPCRSTPSANASGGIARDATCNHAPVRPEVHALDDELLVHLEQLERAPRSVPEPCAPRVVRHLGTPSRVRR